jgi:serine phosphatase RsbU (regulator of sigma subunit)
MGTLKREFNELKEFMLTEEQHDRLKHMGRFRQFFHVFIWLLKHLFLKLTSARRVLLLTGLILIMIHASAGNGSSDVQVNFQFVGALVILFVLMLELKDKLLAHEELEAGRAVQNALMPERSPRVAGWNLWLFTRSANEVGGDLVDFLPVSESRFGIALGDVAGKGLRAALLAAKLQATIRAIASDFISLRDLGCKLNQIFCRDSLPNLFASLVYIEILPDSGAVRVMNAGHLPPLIMQQGTILQMKKAGPALGLMNNASFVEQEIAIDTGSFIFAFSDGAIEARNELGIFYGEERLRAQLERLSHFSAQQIGERIVEDIDRFSGEARRHDDLTIAVLQRV